MTATPQQMQQVEVPVPAHFDPALHALAVLDKLAEKYGPGWQLGNLNIDPRTGEKSVFATRRLSINRITKTGRRTKTVNLDVEVKPTDADKWAAVWADQNPGFYLTSWEPHLGQAKLTALTPGERQCRGAVADAMGVKPWQVQVEARPDGGYDVDLPKYTPSLHDAKLNEVATSIVGKPGWYVSVDTTRNRASIIPADLPTFPPAYGYPFGKVSGDPFILPVGMALGGNGQPNKVLTMNMHDLAGTAAAGLAGSGKSVWLNSIVFSALARGWHLVVLDVRQKMADFLWCKEFVRDSGWGCDSKTEAVAALRLIHEEGVRRGELLTRHGVQKWQDLPAEVRKANPLILVVIDEAQGLFAADPIPKSLPKDHPLRTEAEQAAMESDLLKAYTGKIPAEMRAAGIRMLLVSQQQQQNTGITPTMKMNLPNKVLLGPNATKQARGHALANPDAAPEVPEWIKANEKAAKGTGVAEIEGQAPVVFKGFYASTDDYRDQLRRLGVKTTRQPNPTAEQIARLVPQLNADPDDDEPPAPKRGRGTGNGGGGPSEEWRPPGADQFLREHPEFGAQVSFGADGRRLKGAAAAASAGKKLTEQAAREMCPSCDMPIRPNGDCGCSD